MAMLMSGHLSPGYHTETRRSSLPGPCHGSHVSGHVYSNSTSFAHPQSPGNQSGHGHVPSSDLTRDNDSEHSSEVWQDIVRQLAVS